MKEATNLATEEIMAKVDDLLEWAIRSRRVSTSAALQSVVDIAERLGKRPVLFIEAADQVIPVDDGPRSDTSKTMNPIVRPSFFDTCLAALLYVNVPAEEIN